MLIDLSLPVGTAIPVGELRGPTVARVADLLAQGHVGTHVDRLLGSEIPP